MTWLKDKKKNRLKVGILPWLISGVSVVVTIEYVFILKCFMR